MKTFIINISVAGSNESKPFLTKVRETGRSIEEAKDNGLDGWPAGSFVTSAWEA